MTLLAVHRKHIATVARWDAEIALWAGEKRPTFFRFLVIQDRLSAYLIAIGAKVMRWLSVGIRFFKAIHEGFEVGQSNQGVFTHELSKSDHQNQKVLTKKKPLEKPKN